MLQELIGDEHFLLGFVLTARLQQGASEEVVGALDLEMISRNIRRQLDRFAVGRFCFARPVGLVVKLAEREQRIGILQVQGHGAAEFLFGFRQFMLA